MIQLRRIITLVLLTLGMGVSAYGELLVSINLTTQQIDWVDSFSIMRLPAGIDNNRFGAFNIGEVMIKSPILSYSGAGSHFAIEFDFSPDGRSIQGIGLDTTQAPSLSASFSGTPEGPAVPDFLRGTFSSFALLSMGDYTLSPVGPWSGGIRVAVVPEPATWSMCIVGLGVLVLWKALHRCQKKAAGDSNGLHALQRTRPSRSDCNPRVQRAGALGLGR
jgi:hypothetical protein